jgi:hypothetical protein
MNTDFEQEATEGAEHDVWQENGRQENEIRAEWKWRIENRKWQNHG